MPMVAGIVTVSSKSGANIRTDTGTNGYTWYKVVWNGKVGLISSQVSWLG